MTSVVLEADPAPARTAIDIPAIARFLDQRPNDPHGDALAETFRDRDTHLRALRDRAPVIRARLAAIAGEALDATDRQRKALITERTELASELALIPDAVEVAARRYAAALAAWARHVYDLARHENDKTVVDLAPDLARSRMVR